LAAIKYITKNKTTTLIIVRPTNDQKLHTEYKTGVVDKRGIRCRRRANSQGWAS